MVEREKVESAFIETYFFSLAFPNTFFKVSCNVVFFLLMKVILTALIYDFS